MPFDNDGNVVKEKKKVVIVYADTVGSYKLYRRPVARRGGVLGLLPGQSEDGYGKKTPPIWCWFSMGKPVNDVSTPLALAMRRLIGSLKADVHCGSVTVRKSRTNKGTRGLHGTPATSISRHVSGDWGDMPEEDKQANELALRDGSRIFSAYVLTTGQKVRVITEAADDQGRRAPTTLTLPQEY